MIRIAKYWCGVILALLFASSAVGQQTETLADVLVQNSIPNDAAHIPRSHSRITSYAVLNNPQQFVIAYYLLGENDELHSPLFLLRLNKQTGEWYNAELKDLDFRIPDETTGQTSTIFCLGSALRIQQNEDRYYLDLHLTPSAGCLLILKLDFTVETALPGWDLAFLKGIVLWERNMIHFAPTHPEQLWSYEVATGRSERLYPQPRDPFREDFKHRLAAVVDRNKCRTNNWSCNPDRFASVIEDVEVNEHNATFAIRVGFSTEGFLSREEAEDSGAWYDDEYVYIYRLNPFGWRAFSIYDLKPKFGTDSLKELLTTGKLRVIFAVPYSSAEGNGRN